MISFNLNFATLLLDNMKLQEYSIIFNCKLHFRALNVLTLIANHVFVPEKLQIHDQIVDAYSGITRAR